MSGPNPESNDDAFEITLPRVLDIPGATELKTAVLDKAVAEKTLILKSSEVEQITTPGVQVLMAIAAHVAEQKAKLTVVKPSDVLVDGFNDLGLFSQLMAWNIE